MYGGLLKSASAVAMIAAAGLFTSANAADLGGDCCADLEERVAELEATTVRKGNRKVSLKISGFVGTQVMWWDDGSRSDTYIGMDGGNIFSRWRFTGEAKISPQVTAGFTYEFGLNRHSITSANQANGTPLNGAGAGDDAGECTNSCIRDTTVWIKHAQLGKLKMGQGSTATDNLILIDLGATGSAATPDVRLYNGSFVIPRNGVYDNQNRTWFTALYGGRSYDTDRMNHVLYETPTLAGFTLQAAVAEDNFWDVALRYAGEFGGVRVAFGIGYLEDTEFNSGVAGVSINQCTTDCNRKESEIKGSASILHVPTGLFLTGAAGQRDVENADSLAGPAGNQNHTSGWWYLSGGISQNFFGIGKTVLFGEYGHYEDGLRRNANFNNVASNDVDVWGIGLTQYVDAAAMEVFITYKHFELSETLTGGVPFTGLQDFQTVIVGTKINF